MGCAGSKNDHEDFLSDGFNAKESKYAKNGKEKKSENSNFGSCTCSSADSGSKSGSCTCSSAHSGSNTSKSTNGSKVDRKGGSKSGSKSGGKGSKKKADPKKRGSVQFGPPSQVPSVISTYSQASSMSLQVTSDVLPSNISSEGQPSVFSYIGSGVSSSVTGATDGPIIQGINSNYNKDKDKVKDKGKNKDKGRAQSSAIDNKETSVFSAAGSNAGSTNSTDGTAPGNDAHKSGGSKGPGPPIKRKK